MGWGGGKSQKEDYNPQEQAEAHRKWTRKDHPYTGHST